MSNLKLDKRTIQWIKAKRGSGNGANYSPWLTVRDVPSQGRAHRVHGHLTQRTHHLLSDLEFSTFLLLEWNPLVVDIREQFPLDVEETTAIAKELRIRHPEISGHTHVMSSDFLVDLQESVMGPIKKVAIQVKPLEALMDTRTLEKLRIEQRYWEKQDVTWKIVTESISRNPEELKRIMAAFQYYRTWHLQNRNPAFVPWHTQAYFLVWKITKDEVLKDFIFEMNDWLLSMQQWESAEFTDMQGRFYDPARPYFGPPHASSTGVYLEGLIDAFAIAKELGDQQRVENYRVTILRGIRSLMQLQYKDAVDCFYIKHVDRVLGGVRTTVYDNTIRIDNMQHGLMALLKILSRFSVSDYQLGEPEDNEPLLKNSLSHSFRAGMQNEARTRREGVPI